jgi:hypothetical protein
MKTRCHARGQQFVDETRRMSVDLDADFPLTTSSQLFA